VAHSKTVIAKITNLEDEQSWRPVFSEG